MMTRTILFLVFGLTGIAVLVSLGMWQVQRLAWKEGVLAQIDARIAALPVALPQTA
ncbi:MAG: SURF1 family cytochrome oxidase biogenesis protein, partial [Pseudomonadota bacterium]